MIRFLATVALLTGSAGAALADPETRAFDLVFRGGTLGELSVGAELDYAGRNALGPEVTGEPERVVVELREDDVTTISRQEAEEDVARPLGAFDTRVGNPVAMFFLERTVRAISEETGGSETYIRNRMRDALGGPGTVVERSVEWQGAEVPATEVTLVPFADDPHRDDLGAFAGLQLRVTVSEEVPGWYHSLSAVIPASDAGPERRADLALAELSEEAAQ